MKNLNDLLIPKNINADAVVDATSKRVNAKNAAKFYSALKDDEVWKQNRDLRMKDPSNGFTQDRKFRRIARIPQAIADQAVEKFGPEVFTDKATFRKAFVYDDVGRLVLTVPPQSV